MDLLEHMNAVLDRTFEALEKRKMPEGGRDGDGDDLGNEAAKEQLLKVKTEMAFHQDDADLKKEVAIMHGKEMPCP